MDKIHVELTEKEYDALSVLLDAYKRHRTFDEGLANISEMKFLPHTDRAVLNIKKQFDMDSIIEKNNSVKFLALTGKQLATLRNLLTSVTDFTTEIGNGYHQMKKDDTIIHPKSFEQYKELKSIVWKAQF